MMPKVMLSKALRPPRTRVIGLREAVKSVIEKQRDIQKLVKVGRPRLLSTPRSRVSVQPRDVKSVIEKQLSSPLLPLFKNTEGTNKAC